MTVRNNILRRWRKMIEDTWKNFELSGKVSDYLFYRQNIGVKSQAKVGECGDKMKFSERGMESYGTEHRSDGNGFKCNANGRVR